MSEYTFVAFRAIDSPVTKANLEYMERQSTRAHITPWSFENEYHYGDFRGDAAEMLRRGYDFHLHVMAEPDQAVRRDVLAEFQKSHKQNDWPTNSVDRSISQLMAAADTIRVKAPTSRKRRR